MEKKKFGTILQIVGIVVIVGSIFSPYVLTFLYYENEFLRNIEAFQIIKTWWIWVFTIIFIILGVIIVLIGGKLIHKSRKQIIKSSSYNTEMVEGMHVSRMSEEKILDTSPIAIPKFLLFFADTYILCFTNKRLILYFFDSLSWQFQAGVLSGYFEDKMINKQEELKQYSGNLEELISSHEKNFAINYENIEKVSFLSIFFIRLKMVQNYESRTITFDFIVNNRKRVKSLFGKYLPSIFPPK